MAVWALSSFKSRLSKKQYERLISLLDDSFLQVRTSGCVALGALGSDVSLSGLFNHDLVFDKLLKCLKDGRVNRETVCETLMAFPRGPELLLQTAKANKNTPLVLRAVVKAFKSLDPKDPLAENIAREVLEAARHPAKEVRKASAETFSCLGGSLTPSERASSPYLRPTTLAQTMVIFLADACPEVRQVAREALVEMGPFGRCALIEALRKDKQPLARAECVSGLAEFGVISTRPVVVALTDPDIRVVQSAEAALRTFNLEEVRDYFDGKPTEFHSLVLLSEGILSETNFIQESTLEILRNISSLEQT